MKSYKRKIILLSLGLLLGLAYQALAQDKAATPESGAAATPPTGNAAPAAPAAPAAAPKAAPAAPASTDAKAPAAAPKAADAKAPAATPAAAPAPKPATPASPGKATDVKPAVATDAEANKPVTHVGKRRLTIEQHTAEIIPIDKNVAEVFVSNPDVCDVVINSPGVAYVYGKKPGVTTIFAGSKKGATSLNMDVHVTYNVVPLKKAIQGAYPNENINIISTTSGLILEGTVSSPKESKDIVNMAMRYIGDKDMIVNNLGITMPTQVYLQVKVAEVSRNVLHQLDISWAVRANIGTMTFGLLHGRSDGFNPVLADLASRNLGLNPFSKGTGNATAIGTNVRNGNSLSVTNILDALNTEGLTTVLAEPNLVALSGETAKVLVGGEFPFPVPQGNNAISIQFKQFGIMLDFTPTVLDGGLINLHVRPEVSALDKANGITVNLGGTTNETIPALTTRRAETSVELASGQSLAIAGLFTNTIVNSMNELPGLASVPVLGALFRSANFTRRETELVVIVTPYLVKPVKSPRELMRPNDKLRYATMMGMILGGRLNRPGPGINPDSFVGTNIDGPAEIKNAAQTNFETNLATGEIPALPTNDQSRGSEKAINRPEDLSKLTEVNYAGDAGFYHE